MSRLQHLIEKNKNWSEQIKKEDPSFFKQLSKQQTPEYLWIGCSDSRVSAESIVDVMPGEMFVHRNIANQVVHTDLSCLSVLQYAVEVLKVKHVIVCGHYGCGGVKASLDNGRFGLIDNWLRHIKDVINKHKDFLDSKTNDTTRFDRLCELNVIEQVANVCQTPIVCDAWNREQDLTVHGVIYDLESGNLHDLDASITLNQAPETVLSAAIDKIAGKRD